MVGVLVIIGIALKVLDADTRINRWIKGLEVVSLGLYVVLLSIIGYLKIRLFMLIPNCPEWCEITILFFVTFILSIVIVKVLNKKNGQQGFVEGGCKN